jgi:type VI secretion system protein ImpA
MLAQVLADRASEAEKAGAGAAPQAAPAQGNEPVTAPAGEGGEAPAAAVVAGRVTTQAAARAALEVTEGYFAVSEPSSPARLLLRQARDLMGLSFDEVLQRLAPQRLADPLVRLGSIGDVAITVEALAGTAGDAMESVDGSEVPDFSVSTRQEANALITDVAAWYRKAEPSSPIPVLLDRATELSTMDFPKLMKELVGGEE